jgi:hypothetical protein
MIVSGRTSSDPPQTHFDSSAVTPEAILKDFGRFVVRGGCKMVIVVPYPRLLAQRTYNADEGVRAPASNF